MTNKSTLAVVRVRGIRNLDPHTEKVFEHLRLNKPNHCIVVSQTPTTNGMLERVRNYVTYGAISEGVLLNLLMKRGRVSGKTLRELKKEDEVKKIAKDILGGKKTSEFVDPVFTLHPPRKGYKNLKLHFPLGSLGRRESIDELLKRMI